MAPSFLVNVEGNLYFSANDGLLGTELWKLDGNLSASDFKSDFIAIYPNPVTTAFTVRTNYTNFETLEIIDMDGRKIATERFIPTNQYQFKASML